MTKILTDKKTQYKIYYIQGVIYSLKKVKKICYL